MSADVTGEPHFHVEVHRVPNIFCTLDIDTVLKKMENLQFRSVYF
jgi:hypothetical protein